MYISLSNANSLNAKRERSEIVLGFELEKKGKEKKATAALPQFATTD